MRSHARLSLVVAAALLAGAMPSTILAQRQTAAAAAVASTSDSPTAVIYGCYGLTGVVYLIRQPGLLQNCLTIGDIQHREIAWNQKGAKGDAGDPGPAGPAGPDGAAGPKGPTGDPGPEGPPGEQGAAGDKGLTGDAGAVGAKGETGDKGPAGDQGAPGAKGETGDKGPTGDAGAPGTKGESGDKGPTGDQGLPGEQGPVGDKGEQGDQGPIGDKGPVGDKGETGDQGPQGDKGPTGDPGPQGAPGAGCFDGCVTTASLADLAVTDAKLSPISAAGKIANSATTATSENVPGAIVARGASGDFAASIVSVTTFALGSNSVPARINHDGQRILYRTPGSSSVYLGVDAGPPDGATNPVANTGVGALALRGLTGGTGANTAVGAGAARSVTAACCNTVVGAEAMDLGASPSTNVVVGWRAGRDMTGSRNIVIGAEAGSSLMAGNNNIFIGTAGVEESSTTRIGTIGMHTRAFIAGVNGVAVTGLPVHVATNGQLGILPSSARFKRDIRDLGSASTALHRLRPVSYRYRADIDPDGTPQYGLIAEEVDRVAPELVVRDSNGRPYTVRYGMLVPMLVSEVQALDRDIAEIQREIGLMLRRIEKLEGVKP
jgi:hypothetical protein